MQCDESALQLYSQLLHQQAYPAECIVAIHISSRIMYTYGDIPRIHPSNSTVHEFVIRLPVSPNHVQQAGTYTRKSGLEPRLH